MDRMTALGPGMFEYFASPPSRAAVNECVRKRMNFEHELALQAQRSGQPPPPRQQLWILSAGRPQEALQEHRAMPMSGWPAGFWRAAMDERLCFVLLREVPQDEGTLLLRLVARGSVGSRAMAELVQLRESHPLRERALPVLVAYRADIVQDLEKAGSMTTYEQVMALYNEYEQRIRQDEAQRVRQEEALRIRQEEALRLQLDAEHVRQQQAQNTLARLLTHRFGALPDDALARIQHADHETLERWTDRVLTAQSLDDIFA